MAAQTIRIPQKASGWAHRAEHVKEDNCLDNAVKENLFGMMKTGLLNPGNYSSLKRFGRELREH